MKNFTKLISVICIGMLGFATIPNAATTDSISDTIITDSKISIHSNYIGIPRINLNNIGTSKLNYFDYDSYFDSMNKKYLSHNDKLIASKDVYIKINQGDVNNKSEVVTKEEFEEENSNTNQSYDMITPYGYNPNDDINLPDKYDWISLRINVYSLSTSIHGNRYRFSIGYNWKRKPFVVCAKDVFGIANDGNVVLLLYAAIMLLVRLR